MTITEAYGELYRQESVSMLVLYSTTSITVDYEEPGHHHCRLLTPGVDYAIRTRARSLYSVDWWCVQLVICLCLFGLKIV